MLIKWATENDLNNWFSLAIEMSPIFRHPNDMAKDKDFITYAGNKVSKYEALVAVDRMSNTALGFIGFSRTHNCITWFGVLKKHRKRGAGSKLLKTALRQLDNNRLITVETFPEGFEPGIPAKNLYRKFGFVETDSNLTGPFDLPICRMTLDLSDEKRGRSFHYHYPDFAKRAQKEFCPVCTGQPGPEGHIEIATLEYCFVVSEYPGQGKLFGKMYVMPKKHAEDFEDMPEEEMVGFMKEVQLTGKALHKVTGAVKINYEMHANSGSHLHIHLFPRYLDDDFPSAPIDYRMTEPAPYESYDEYLWFIEQMRKEYKIQHEAVCVNTVPMTIF